MIHVLGCQILNDSSGIHSKWKILDDFKFFFFFFYVCYFSFCFSFFFLCIFFSLFFLLICFSLFFFGVFFSFSFSFSFSFPFSFVSFVFSFWVVLLGFFLLRVVLRFSSPFAWCCLVSSFFGWCCRFSFTCLVVPPPPLGGAAFSHDFCWVVLRGLLLLFGWCCCFFPLLFGGVAGAAWFLPPWGGVAFHTHAFNGVPNHHNTGVYPKRPFLLLRHLSRWTPAGSPVQELHRVGEGDDCVLLGGMSSSRSPRPLPRLRTNRLHGDRRWQGPGGEGGAR